MLFSLCIRQDILLLLSGVSVALLRKAQNGVAYFLKLSESTAKAACFSSKTSRDSTLRTWTNSSASHYHSH